MDPIVDMIEAVGGPPAFVAIWSWIIISAVLTVVLIYLFVKHKTNQRFKQRLEELTPQLDRVIENLQTGLDQDGKIRSLISKSEFPELIRYIEDRLVAIGKIDAQAERQLAEASGLVEYLNARVKSRDNWKRALALRALACLRDETNVPLFRATLKNEKFDYAILAATAGLAWVADVDSLELILDKVYVDDPPNRDVILKVLVAYGEDACEAATRLLGKGDLPTAVEGAMADFLGNIHYAEAASVIEERLAATDDTNSEIHFLEALENLGSESTCAVIEPYLKSDDFRLRLKAINALERLGGDKYLAKAEETTRDESPWVARNGAEAMSRMGKKGEKKLNALSRSENRIQRQAAKLVLAELEYKRMRWRFRYADSIP
jgi:HEAT repeat protein